MWRLLICLGLLLSCKEQSKVEATALQPVGGWYRAVLSKGAAEAPFYLSLPPDERKGGAVIMNGKQWFSAKHQWTGDRVEVDFVLYRTKILATVDEDGSLFGTWENGSRAFGPASLTFKAQPVDEPDPETRMRTSSSAAPAVKAAGIWKLDLSRSGPGKLIVEKQGETAIGATIWFSTGVTVYLAGNIVGRRIFLSGFDGTGPYLLAASLEGDTLEGEWCSGPDFSYGETISAKRVAEDFDVDPPLEVAAVDRRMRLLELESPRYSGKPVIVQLAGSWCAHCKASAPVLGKLYDRYQSEGLKILTINYEFTEDKSHNLVRAAQYKNEYGITWQLVTRDGGMRDFWRIMPASLAGRGFVAFPITLFVKRDATIHAVHSGFVGPESGDAHTALKAKFERWTKEILR